MVEIQSGGNPFGSDIGTTEVADNAITLAKLAGGTAGSWINFDASGDPQEVVGGCEHLGTTTLGSGASSISVASLDTDRFSKLLIVWDITGNSNSAVQKVWIRFNNDSGSNYDFTHWNDAGAASDTAGTTVIHASHHDDTLGGMGYGIISNSATDPQRIIGQGGAPANIKDSYVGEWGSSAEITRVDILNDVGNFNTGSKLSVYGIG